VDRRLLHKIAIVGGALVAIGGAIVVLRDPTDGPREDPIPPPQTSVNAYADESVVVPQRGDRPKPPPHLDIRASNRRLVIGWGQDQTAAGYEVRWGERDDLNHTRLIAEPAVQLDGLQDGLPYRVEVRTVDSFGQRSEPARGTGTPAPRADDAPYALVDRFEGRAVPQPALWRLIGSGKCTKASRGDGDDARRLVITGQCGNSEEAVSLRSRAPLRLRPRPDGELGRVTIVTDRPGQVGDLLIDLVPGPADLVGVPPGDMPGQPGQAATDPTLPPGVIRVWIAGRTGPKPATAVQVLAPPGTPTLGKPVAVNPAPPARIGVSVRWDVVLRVDGVRVERDGMVVGGADVVPSFTEATVLFGFSGAGESLRASIDLIGLSGGPTEPPASFDTPRVDFAREVAAPGGNPEAPAGSSQIDGVRGGQVRITLVPQRDLGDGQFTVDIGGRAFPLRKAIPGQPGRAGVRLPMVADIPPEALVTDSHGDSFRLAVRSQAIEGNLATQVLTADIELAGDAPALSLRTSERALPRPPPTLATPVPTLSDASGVPIPSLRDVPRGRLVLDVALDAAKAQRQSGEVAKLAGVEITMDGRPIAGIPTVADGPGIGGHWRIALNTTELPAGAHIIQVTAIGAEVSAAYVVGQAPFVIH
jgi:hypothetical protein